MQNLLAKKTADRFIWHPSSRIVQGRGDINKSAADALASAFADAALGQPFRIGGGFEPPRAGPVPMFETLTSGTSGTPRRIWRSQASWTASFAVNAELFGIGPGTQVAILGQLNHSLALYGALEALHLGASLHLLADMRPDRQRSALAQGRVEVMYVTPAQARLIADCKGLPLPSLRLILIGGSKLDTPLRERLADMAPSAELREFYGAAETSFLTIAVPTDPPASVGRAYPRVSLKVCDADGRALPDRIEGEIWVQSPYLFADYSADPGTAIWQDGWLSVGEIGHVAGELVYLSGRKNRVVQIADQSVYPEQIEAFMATCAGIDRVAVVPEADAKRGVRLIAVAMGDPTHERAILAATRAYFGPLKTPRRIVWRDDWPTLASGKTDLASLIRVQT